MSNVVFNFYGPEELFGVLSVVPGYLSLRVYFTDLVIDDDELRDPSNYSIVGSGLVPTDEVHNSDVWGVTPEDVEYPSYVDLDCTDLTHGELYLLTITPSRITKYDNSVMITSNNTAEYAGVSELPRIQTVRSISSTLLEVIFTKEMSPLSGILNTAAYSFDKGLRVREVTIVAPGVVHLLTTTQTPSEIYTLTFNPAVYTP